MRPRSVRPSQTSRCTPAGRVSSTRRRTRRPVTSTTSNRDRRPFGDGEAERHFGTSGVRIDCAEEQLLRGGRLIGHVRGHHTLTETEVEHERVRRREEVIIEIGGAVQLPRTLDHERGVRRRLPEAAVIQVAIRSGRERLPGREDSIAGHVVGRHAVVPEASRRRDVPGQWELAARDRQGVSEPEGRVGRGRLDRKTTSMSRVVKSGGASSFHPQIERVAPVRMRPEIDRDQAVSRQRLELVARVRELEFDLLRSRPPPSRSSTAR